MKKRERRRKDLKRMKDRAFKAYPDMGKRAKSLANHIKCCSCWMCGNPRKQGEKTAQELKSEIDEQEEIDEEATKKFLEKETEAEDADIGGKH